MGSVNYNGKAVSDDDIKLVLQAIGKELKSDVNVTSGDRNYVPAGGSATSLHLVKRAADFHVDGMTDGAAYQQIMSKALNIFGVGFTYEFIWHGNYTITQGAHLHVGRKGSSPIGTVEFIQEGQTAATKGDYKTELSIPILNQD